MYKHLIFDLDGTIADTLPSITDSVNVTLKYFHNPHHYRVDEVYNFVGYGTPYLLKKAFANEQINLEQVLAIYLPAQLKIHLKKAKLFPGLLVTLNTLKERGYKLYIATNKPIEVAPKTIDKLYGKNYFVDGVYQSRNTPKKPNPYVINALIRRHHLKREECLYIGDGEVDLLTAKNAKIDAMLVKYGYGQYGKFDEGKAKFVIKHPKEMLNYLK